MALQTGDMKFKLSANGGLGGAIQSGDVPNTLNGFFDLISAQEGTDGMIDYRCLYIKNETAGSNALINGAITLASQASDTYTTIAIGLAPEGINGTAQAIGDENTEPTGVTFSDSNTPITFPANIEKNEYIALWIRRTVTSGSSAINDSTTLSITGETSA